MSELTDNVLSKLSPEEQEAVKKILGEYTEQGHSQTLKKLYEDDFTEIPVSIDEFIEKDEYAGWFTNNGKNIFPYWRKKLREIFDENKNFSEIVLGGSIGCGKSTIAVIGLAYTLYWLMCLKDPNPYFGLGRGDTIFLVFFNATLQLSRGVAYNKFQSILQHSPWFMERGTISGTKHLEYTPNKTENADIQFMVGSQPEHALGKAILCLDGKTRIYTEKGVRSLKDLEGQFIRIYTKHDNGTIKLTDSPIEIRKTGTETELVEIELEDGCILRCTYNHKLKLTSGEYVEAKDLTEGMDLDSGNCKTSGVYCITNLINGKKYIGKSDNNVLVRLRHHMQGKKSNSHLQDSIKKYGIENFRFEILELCDKSICGQRERYWIEKFDTFKNGYNHTTGGEGESGWHLSPEAIEKTAKVHRGKIMSEHTKKLLSDARKGTPISEENKKKLSKMFRGKGNPFYGKHHTEETKQKLSKIHKNTPKSTIDKLSNFRTKDNIGRFWINDGVNNKFVHQNVYDNLDQTIWKKGRLFDNKGKVGTIFVNNGHESRQIKLEESELYFALGWTKGLIKKKRRKKSESKKSDKNNN